MSDHLILPGFLDRGDLDAIVTAMRCAAGDAAPVYGDARGGAISPSVRKVLQLHVDPAIVTAVTEKLERSRPRLSAHFALPLGNFDPLQFLRYREGDFFVAHQDGNVPLIYDDSRFRRVSIVIFVNAQGESAEDFGGGSLVLHGPYSRPADPVDVTSSPGTLVAFRSETTHEVTPVTRGERLTIVTWFRAP